MSRLEMYEPVILDSEVACSICDEYIPAGYWLMEDAEYEVYVCMNCWHLHQFSVDIPELVESLTDL